jgi:hypothetical protein
MFGGLAAAQVTVHHRLALGNRPAFSSAPARKSFASVSFSVFAQHGHIGRGLVRCQARAENVCGPLYQLRPRLLDKVGMYTGLVRQLA